MSRALSTSLRFGLLACCMACDSSPGSASVLDSVRILTVQSDLPYAAPGETITSRVLAYDGRADPASAPMRTYWLRELCLAPQQDSLEACYREIAERYPRDVDLVAETTEGETASFAVPADALDGVTPRMGDTEPYRAAFVFVAACAGRLRNVGARAEYPGEPPIACVDEHGERLGRADFVFAFARVFVFAERRNANPAVRAVTFDGAIMDEATPLEVPRCEAENPASCRGHAIGIEIDDDAQETDPGSVSLGEAPSGEQVWSSFFASRGELTSEVLLHFEGLHRRLPPITNGFVAPRETGDVDLFVVTHDDRAGVSWRRFVLRVQ